MGYYPTSENCQISLSFIYEQYFGLRNEGYFVDVGAYNGIDFSNTWGLAKRGWTGLALEPNPQTFAQLKNNYKEFESHVICLELAAGKSGEAQISLAGSISTCSPDQYVQFLHNGWVSGQESFAEVHVLPLDEILGALETPINFDVFSLDVEGLELEVLETFTIDKWKPKLCLVESHEHHPITSFGRHAQQINEYFEKAGYYKIYCDMVNNIYVRKDFK